MQEIVEVVIKIPKRTYDRVSERGIIAFGDDAYYIGHAIANGTVLLKGHDKLVSACAIKAMINDEISTDTDADKEYVCELIDNIMAVIEADKE